MRQPAFDSAEKQRTACLTKSTVVIQSLGRGFLFRCRYLKRRQLIILGQASGRRFLARKYMKAIREKKYATKIQTMVRRAVAHAKFVRSVASVCIIQTIYRGFIQRKHYKAFYKKTMAERKANEAATSIQKVARGRTARVKFAEVKKTTRPSKKYTEMDSKAFQEAIKADRAAAVAKASAQKRAREVHALEGNLADAEKSANKAKAAMVELEDTKLQLATAQEQLETLRKEMATALASIGKLEKENAEMKEKLESGVFVSGEIYTSKMYSEYSDLQALDQQLFNCMAASKKSKEDVKSLVSVLSLLK